jgi:hypothetical protein
MKSHLLLLALTVVGGSAVLRAQGNNVFETRHAGIEAKNPAGLSMILDTRHSKRSYSEGEYIPLVISYSSDIRYKYRVETGIGWKAAAESQRLYTDEKLAPVWCAVAHVGDGQRLQPLSSQPVIVPHCLSVRLKPGKHELYVTARQVFPWSTQEESGKELSTTSNILRLDITPDPGWQERDLARTMRDYDKHPTASCRELSTLDISEATTEKLKLLDRGHCGHMLSFYPTEYETAQRTIEQWIYDPDPVVTDAAIDALTTVRASMGHPDLLTGSLDDPEEQQAIGRAWISALETSKTALAKQICTTLPTKSRSAQVPTKNNVCEVLTWQPVVEDTACDCRDTTKR